MNTIGNKKNGSFLTIGNKKLTQAHHLGQKIISGIKPLVNNVSNSSNSNKEIINSSNDSMKTYEPKGLVNMPKNINNKSSHSNLEKHRREKKYEAKNNFV